MRTMSKFFVEKGFEKVRRLPFTDINIEYEKAKHTFYKKVNDNYIAVVDFIKLRNFTKITVRPGMLDLHIATHLDYYEICISVYHQNEIENYGLTYKDLYTKYPLTLIADIRNGVWLQNNPKLVESMKETFDQFVFKPLFLEQKIYDFIYTCEYKRFGQLDSSDFYDSYPLLMASYDEKKYDMTEKYLHIQLALLYDPDCRMCISKYDSFTVGDLIAMIEQSRNLDDTEKYLFVKFKELYDNIKRN